MNELMNITKSGELTMSSREIADVCEKQHKHVKRDIEKMFADLNLDGSKFGRIYKDDKNRSQTEYLLPKDLSITLVSGYRIDLRYRLVKHIEKLEAERNQAPQLNDPTWLRGALIEYTEKVMALESQVDELKPSKEALDRLESCEGSLIPRLASKTLGYPERKLIKWLELNSWAFRQAGKGPLQAYSEKKKQGFLDHRLDKYYDPASGEERVRPQLLITPKGLSRLAQVLPH